MAKFKIKSVGDFPLPVKFFAPDGTEYEITFCAKHVKIKDVAEKLNTAGETNMSDIDFMMDHAIGWDVEEEFNKENLTELLELYPSIVLGFVSGYTAALAGQRTKN